MLVSIEEHNHNPPTMKFTQAIEAGLTAT